MRNYPVSGQFTSTPPPPAAYLNCYEVLILCFLCWSSAVTCCLFIDHVSCFRETLRTNSQYFADHLMGLFNGQSGFVAVIKYRVGFGLYRSESVRIFRAEYDVFQVTFITRNIFFLECIGFS